MERRLEGKPWWLRKGRPGGSIKWIVWMIRSFLYFIISWTWRERGRGWDGMWICSGIACLGNWLSTGFLLQGLLSFFFLNLLAAFDFPGVMPTFFPQPSRCTFFWREWEKLWVRHLAVCEGEAITPTWWCVHGHFTVTTCFRGKRHLQILVHQLLTCSVNLNKEGKLRQPQMTRNWVYWGVAEELQFRKLVEGSGQLCLWTRSDNGASSQSPGSEFIDLKMGRDSWQVFTGQETGFRLL